MMFSSALPEDRAQPENSSANPEESTSLAPSQPNPPPLAKVFGNQNFPNFEQVKIISETKTTSEDGNPEIILQLQRGPYSAAVTVHHEEFDILNHPNVHPILYIPGLSDTVFNPFAAHASDETAFCYVSVDINKQSARNAIHIPSMTDAMESANIALDWICNEHQNKVVLSGFSLGGLIAAKLASSCEDQVSAVVLLSPSLLSPTISWIQSNIIMRGSLLFQRIKEYLSPQSESFISTETYSTLIDSLKTSDHGKIFLGIKAPIQISMEESEGFSKTYYEFLLSFCHPDRHQLDVFAGKLHTPDNTWKIVAALDFIEKFYPPSDRDAE